MKSKIKVLFTLLFVVIGITISYAQPGYAGEWKKTRLYGHTYSSDGFTKEQYDFIRDHFEIFCFEKTHLNGVYGNPSHEKSSKIEAAYLKTLNPRCKPITIYSIRRAYPLWNESTKEALTNNPEWAPTTDNITYNWDLSIPEQNDWYVETMNDLVNNSELEGIFIDGLEGAYSAYGTEVKSIMERMDGLSLMNGFNPKSATTFKTGPDFLEHCAGVFIDSWFRRELDTKEGAQTMIDACMAVPEDKVMILFSGNNNDGIWGTDHTFSHAAYLIVANENTYYRWTGDGLWGEDVLMEYHEDFDKEMGAPFGKAKKNGYVYTRVFEHCTVTLDVENATSSIIWNQNNVYVPEPEYENIALNGTATQSTTAYSGDASRAIDGNTDGVYTNNSVSHTGIAASGTWWMVTLADNYTIGDITIYNRTDGYTDRLSNFTVEVLNNAGMVVYTKTISSTPNPSITVNAGDITGNRVRILQNTASTALALAEVEVYGTTPSTLSTKTELTQDNKFFSITPNPVKGIMNINLVSTETATYQVFNTVGQLLLAGTINNGAAAVNLSHFTNDLYLIKVSDRTTSATQKIIKE